jgi:hypothetical protein
VKGHALVDPAGRTERLPERYIAAREAGERVERQQRRDVIPGGLADTRRAEEFDTGELAQGVKVEMEHTGDPEIAREIAMDHLAEIPDYYTRLAAMEAGAEATVERLATVPDDVLNDTLARSGRTAITRGGPSSVARWLHERGHLRGPILDYGSGMGEDAHWLREQGYKVRAYDPVHGPRIAPGKAIYNTILCTFVLNTLPASYEAGILADLRALLRPDGVAYIAVRDDVEGGRRGKGGSATYQRDVRLPLDEAADTPSGVRLYWLTA